MKNLTSKSWRTSLVMALWGFAEATLFFIVPDVGLTWLAIDQKRRAWWACLWTTLGAVVGGIVMYAAGASRPDAVVAMLEMVPAVNRSMINGVRQDMESHGLLAMFFGPLTGTPYKIYASHAGAMGLSVVLFVLVSVPARAARFLIVVGLIDGGRRLLPDLSLGWCRAIHLLFWVGFYIVYFAITPS